MKQVWPEGKMKSQYRSSVSLDWRHRKLELEQPFRGVLSWARMVRPLHVSCQSATDCGPPWEREFPSLSLLLATDVVPQRMGSYGLSVHCTPRGWGNKPSRKGDWVAHNSICHIRKRKKDLKPCQKLYLICATIQSLHDFIQLSKQMWSLQNFPWPS